MTEHSVPVKRPMDGQSGLPYSTLTTRIAGRGATAWAVHGRAMRLAEQGRDVIFLSVGDPDFETPSPVVEAAVDAMRGGRTHYVGMSGIPELRAAIARRHKAMTGQHVESENVVVMAGAQASLYSTLMCLAGPGDEVIAPEPRYATYEAVVGACGATMVDVPLRGERGFHIDPDDVAAAITPSSRVLLINFPHNPTGATITADELAGLAELCIKHDLWLVSDEVYATLVYEGTHISPCTLPGMADRTVVISSLSKSHAMPGWRLGWAVAPGDLPAHLGNLAQCMLFGTPPFIQDAAVVALSREFHEIDTMHEEFRHRRDMVAERINAMPLVSCRPPEGSMFAMIDVRGSGLSSIEFATRLVDAEALSILPGDGFGPSAEGYLRMSLTAPRDRLEEACDRIERFVTGLNR